MLLWLYGCALPLAAAWVVAPRARLPPPAPRGAAAARAARSSPRMAVWSDMKAVMEYQDRLEGKFQVDVPDQASVILGDTPLARVLAGFGLGDDVRVADVADGAWTLPDAVVNARDERLQSYPIYACVSREQVEPVIQRTPSARRDDLVFFHEDDFLEPILQRHALHYKEHTQARAR